VDATRFGCETCRANDLEPARWDKSELVDLRTEEPPLADDGDERGRLVADGGRSMTRRESERRARTLAAGMIEWANRAGVDADDVLRHVRERVNDVEDDHGRTTHLHVGRDADGRPSAIYRDLDRGISAVDSDSALHRHVERLSVDIPVVDDGLDFDDDRDGDDEGEVIRA
jgi:hypothetical protein